MESAIALAPLMDQGHVKTLWVFASSEADKIVAALARISVVAQRYAAPRRRPVPSELRTWAEHASGLPKPGKCRRVTRAAVPDTLTAASKEDAKLENALQMAFSLADEIGNTAARLTQLKSSVLPVADQRALLRSLFLQKARTSGTLLSHIRSVCRLRSWASSKGLNPWRLQPVEIAYFLRDASHGHLSVPRSLLSGLEWLQTALQLGWDLKEPAVQSFAALTAREASAARLQACPYTYPVCLDLMQLLAKLDGRCAAAYTVLFLLCLAYACLRFSDLDRSVSVTLGRDAIHATSWRSKGKPMPTPWAALRKTWTDVDWGKQFYDLIQGILPVSINEQPRDWLWPAMDLEDGTLHFSHPARHGSYANCLMAMAAVHRLAGHSAHYTLHSPRFLICGMAGQAGFTMEQRRSMGRWGPASGMPVRYDQSRCCAELDRKSVV